MNTCRHVRGNVHGSETVHQRHGGVKKSRFSMRLGVAAAAAAGVVLLLLAALPGAQPERIDYYEVLGVERDASTMVSSLVQTQQQ